MTEYYLRVEGVNLYSVLEDTEQLSVIRGGGLLLRNAIRMLGKAFQELEKVSSGASVGLFKFTAQDENKAHGLAQRVSNWLNLHFRLQHFTFVVDVQAQQDGADFQHNKEAVLARNRFRQMQQLTVAMPEQSQSPQYKACDADNLRPAARTGSISGGTGTLSVSVFERLRYGSGQKRVFYREETSPTGQAKGGLKLSFTADLQDLATLSAEQAKKPELRQLNNKIAVLYFDGNGFSKIQNTYCVTEVKQIEFDDGMQGKRKDFLIGLLDKIQHDSDFKTKDGELRLETLLWGGDEMTFVVPAWKGLEVLNCFYEYSTEWRFREKKLTHAGGMVFCSAKTPIQRVTKLARELADAVKNTPHGRNCNLFDYMVLESIDFPTERMDTSRARQFGKDMSEARAPLMPFNDKMQKAARWLKENIPKGQAYACARAALADYRDDGARLPKQVARLAEVTKIGQDKIETGLDTLFPANEENIRWQWLHLVDLWDYLTF